RNQFIGPGYLKAVNSEKNVSAFRSSAEDRGTPFIELDDSVVKYASDLTDKCVKVMFNRLTKFDGERFAIFPFKRLTEAFGSCDPMEDLKSISIIRGWIKLMKNHINKSIAGADKKAVAKGRHYLDALDDQLRSLAQTEALVMQLEKPAIAISYGKKGIQS